MPATEIESDTNAGLVVRKNDGSEFQHRRNNRAHAPNLARPCDGGGESGDDWERPLTVAPDNLIQ
jgi:hypothetical protein